MNQGWSDPSEIAKSISKKKADVLYWLQTETPVVKVGTLIRFCLNG